MSAFGRHRFGVSSTFNRTISQPKPWKTVKSAVCVCLQTRSRVFLDAGRHWRIVCRMWGEFITVAETPTFIRQAESIWSD